MEKFLFVETNELIEIVPIDDQELIVIKPLIQQITMDRYRAVKSNGKAKFDDHEKWGQLPGWETLVQFIPDGGISSIKTIKVVNIVETLMA